MVSVAEVVLSVVEIVPFICMCRGVFRIFSRRVLSNRKVYNRACSAREILATPTFKSRKHDHIMHAFARACASPRTLIT